MSPIFLFLFCTALFASDEVTSEVSHYEREVRLSCDTKLKDLSQPRQIVALAASEKIKVKLIEIKKEIQKLNLNIKYLTESSFDQNEIEFKETKIQYENEAKRYQLLISDGNLGRNPAAIENQLDRLRGAQRKLEVSQKNLNAALPSKKIQDTKEVLEKSYKDLEGLLALGDRYQSLLRRALDCAQRENNEPKLIPEVEVPNTTYKRRTSD